MTVKELIQELLKYEMDAEVFVVVYDFDDNYQVYSELNFKNHGKNIEIEVEDEETMLISSDEFDRLRAKY